MASAIALCWRTALGHADDGRFLLPPTPSADLEVQVVFLPEGRDAIDAPLPDGAERLVITGTYTSAERPEPVGFVLRRGRSTNSYAGGPDGLLLIDAAGRASIHDISRVAVGGGVFNLRDRAETTPFLALAETAELTAVQTHLLINDGALDLRDVSGQPRFRRRLLFETDDGRIGVFDTGAQAMTLYEAAVALRDAINPRMALNLDMGTFDFCERRTSDGSELCGLLRREGIEKLTNLIVITRLTSE